MLSDSELLQDCTFSTGQAYRKAHTLARTHTHTHKAASLPADAHKDQSPVFLKDMSELQSHFTLKA